MWNEHNTITRTIKKVMPSVVSITLKKPKDLVIEQLKEEQKAIHEKSHIEIPEDKIDAQGLVDVGGGSGFIIDGSGIILTNRHVIEEKEVLYFVTTHDNHTYEAELLAKDPVDDIAILRIQPTRKLRAVKLGDSAKVELGQTAIAFGNALGLFKDTVSMGIISGLSRAVSARENENSAVQEMRGLIQTDAAINPGNSGGPLVNIYGRVVGINAAVVASAESISFAIPINTAKRDIKDLKKYGKIRRPLFGVRYLVLNQTLKEKLKTPVDYGALITKEHTIDVAVASGSPADKAGIKENDILLRWNGIPITETRSIQDFLESHGVGDEVTLAVLRNGIEIERRVTLEERK
ncbi:MAG: trypsin-like serine protease with C-terminal PDZ domain [Parcubacteria group bacterium LiPW_41]|nr:MAG: trypsin-like serine protease with C-terminal PDZ domain [Parcubacteria group bacterium LiPW_41]